MPKTSPDTPPRKLQLPKTTLTIRAAAVAVNSTQMNVFAVAVPAGPVARKHDPSVGLRRSATGG